MIRLLFCAINLSSISGSSVEFHSDLESIARSEIDLLEDIVSNKDDFRKRYNAAMQKIKHELDPQVALNRSPRKSGKKSQAATPSPTKFTALDLAKLEQITIPASVTRNVREGKFSEYLNELRTQKSSEESSLVEFIPLERKARTISKLIGTQISDLQKLIQFVEELNAADAKFSTQIAVFTDLLSREKRWNSRSIELSGELSNLTAEIFVPVTHGNAQNEKTTTEETQGQVENDDLDKSYEFIDNIPETTASSVTKGLSGTEYASDSDDDFVKIDPQFLSEA